LRWLFRLRESSATDRTGYTQVAIVLGVVAWLFVLDVIVATPFEAARVWVFDAYQGQWPPVRSSSRTVVVEIDEESIRRFGQWPWPRDLLATLLTQLQGASVVGIDLLMPDADRLSPDDLIRRYNIRLPALGDALLALPSSDEALARAIRAQPTVLAMTVDDRENPGPGAPVRVNPVREQGDLAGAALLHGAEAAWPLPILMQAARGAGIVSASLETDGALEKLPVVTEVHGTLLPGFAAELMRVALNSESIVLKAQLGIPSAVSIDGLTFHIDPSGDVRPRFVGPARLSAIKAHQLLDPGAQRVTLEGKIVVIGVTAQGLGKSFRVPPGTRESSPAVQAETVESVLAGDTLWRPFWASPGERVAGLVLSLASGLLLGRIRYRTYVLMLTGVLLALIGGSVWAFRYHGILLDCVFPGFCPLVSGLAASTARVGIEVAAQRKHKAELAVERARRAAVEREFSLRTEVETLRQNLAFAVDAAGLGVWDADLRSGVWHHSPRLDTILGLTTRPSRWSPDVLLNCVVAEDRAAAARGLAEGQASGSLQLECGIRRQDGSRGYIHILGRSWKDADGVANRVAGVVVDITKQRELELRLRQGEKMQAIGLLAGGVAHNFNNLLTVVLGNLELASGKVDASGRTGLLIGNAMEAAHKSAAIARQLLAFARLQPLNPKPADAAELLKGIFLPLCNALPATVHPQLEMAPDLGTIRIDPVDFELTLLNLAMNARDAMPGGGHLILHAFSQDICDNRLGLDGYFLVVEVKDDGEGMSPETVSNVFEPFFTTKPVGHGTGLGLSQVHGFAHQSGGAVEIESARGRGTCVRLYLPLAKQEPLPSEARQREVSS
jgi:signal transduction histidine kinase/CHASE2 domain-containing sensor protein